MWGGGGGPVTSLKVNFQGGGSNICYGEGRGRQTFFQGNGVQLLSNRTYDLYLTPVPALDPRNYQQF